MKSEYNNFIEINQFNKNKFFSKEESEEHFSDISFGIEERFNGHLIPFDDEIREKG